MRYWLCFVLALVLAVGTLPAIASASWEPGTPILVNAHRVIAKLTQTYPKAWCEGVPYYGHNHDRFNIFRCAIYDGHRSCNSVRFEARKGAAPREFYLVKIRKGRCP